MRDYGPRLALTINRKGVLDLDTVKGCTMGCLARPGGGCYGLCYAWKLANAFGIDFSKSVTRKATTKELRKILAGILSAKELFVRIGTMGDPSHSWPWTIKVSEEISGPKPVVIITKHWIELTSSQMEKLGLAGVVLNTSISPLDTEQERTYRLEQYNRYKSYGKSILRIVSCDFNRSNQTGAELSDIHETLFNNDRVLDNPLRLTADYTHYNHLR